MATEEQVTCNYNHLQGNEIRLLRFKSRASTPLQFELAQFNRDGAPAYNALSYTWGPPPNTHAIIVNDQSLLVRSNLADFLAELANKPEHSEIYCEWWWIDSICINQGDDIEKSHQVMAMSKIFSEAQEVVIWLGAEDQESDIAIALINDVFSLARKFVDLWLSGASIEVQDLLAAYKAEYGRDLVLNDWIAYGNLLSRPWWRRAWVVQEASAKMSASVWCGSSITSLTNCYMIHTLMEFVNIRYVTPPAEQEGDMMLTSHPISLASKFIYNSSSTRIVTMLLARHDFVGNGPMILIETLDGLRWFESEDPRDKIFAFLGLFNTEVGYTANYAKDIRSTYLDFAKQQLEEKKNWDVLSAWKPDEVIDLPSWVPDWSTSSGPLLFNRYKWSDETLDYNSLYGANSGLPTATVEITDQEELIIYGIVVDKVAAVSGICHRTDDSCGRQWTDFALEHTGNFDALSHVLCGDLYPYAHQHARAKRGGAASIKTLLSHQQGLNSGIFTNAAVEPVTSMRRLISTPNGLLGIGPPKVQVGDDVVVLCGCQMPFVMRAKPHREGEYTLIGEAYVHGIMDGEAVSETVDLKVFKIV